MKATLALFFMLSMAKIAAAQVVVDSQPYVEDVFAEQTQADPGLSLFLWFLFAVSFVSFLIFWFNREYVLLFLGWGKNNLEVDFQDFEANQELNNSHPSSKEEKSGAQKADLSVTDNAETDVSIEDDTVVHDVPVQDMDDEYKKPKLKLIVEEGEPKLVFE